MIGYSFRDPHINAPIMAAIEKGLKLYIISPLLPRDFYSSLQSVHGGMLSGNFDPDSHKLWNGLAGYFQGTVGEFFNWKRNINRKAKAFLDDLELR